MNLYPTQHKTTNMTREEARKFGLSLLNGIMERNKSYPVYANNVKQAIEALSDQPSLPSDLNEAAEEHAGLNFDRQMEYKSFWNDVDTFKAGAEWQKKKDDELLTIAYMDGVTDGKAKMLEEALHYVAQPDIPIGNILTPFIRIGNTALSRYGIKVGDKVRIIIVKED